MNMKKNGDPQKESKMQKLQTVIQSEVKNKIKNFKQQITE